MPHRSRSPTPRRLARWGVLRRAGGYPSFDRVELRPTALRQQPRLQRPCCGVMHPETRTRITEHRPQIIDGCVRQIPPRANADPFAEALHRRADTDHHREIIDFDDATEQINLAFENDQIPILVGGTSFYFKALENGLSSLPESTQETKSKYKKIIEENSSEYLHKKLMEIDPVSAERIHHNDSQRIIRAMEVYELSGSPMSELQGQKMGGLNHPIKKIVLMPERSILHERIENRFIDMMKEGFLEEVKEIIKEYNLSADSPSMRCVGYRQVLNFLEGKNSNSEMIENSIYASRQLCKRQCTWLNAEEDALFLKDANIKEFSNLIKPFL